MARNRHRLLPVLIAGMLAAIVLSGCLAVLKSQSAEQVDAIGDVRITSTMCLGLEVVTGPPYEAECDDYSGLIRDGDPRAADLLAEIRAAREAEAAGGTRAARRGVPAIPTHEDVMNGLLGGIGFSQITIAYKVPEGATAPDSLVGALAIDPDFEDDMNELNDELLWPLLWGLGGIFASEFPAPPTPTPPLELPTELTFRSDSSLGDALGDPGAGMKWAGYVSEQQLPFILTGDLTIEADFGLPDPGDEPYAGPFPFETVQGIRQAMSKDDLGGLALAYDAFDLDQFLPEILDLFGELLEDDEIVFRSSRLVRADNELLTALSPARPVDCEESLLGDSTICEVEPVDVDTAGEVATGDLRIRPTATPQARQGETAQVPFLLDYAGPAAGQPFALFAQTGLPFSSATPDPGAYTPGANEQKTVNVAVPVPLDARPGLYHTELIATVGDQERRAVGTVEVLAKEAAAPAGPVVQTILLGRLAPDNVTATVSSRLGNAAAVRRSRRARRAKSRRLKARAAQVSAWTVRTRGEVIPPPSLTEAEACAGGVVSVQVKSRWTTVSHRVVSVEPDCSYDSRVTFTEPSRFRRRRATVGVAFRGNNRLLPRRAEVVSVNVPRSFG